MLFQVSGQFRTYVTRIRSRAKDCRKWRDGFFGKKIHVVALAAKP
jgi:hypothetical protein